MREREVAVEQRGGTQSKPRNPFALASHAPLVSAGSVCFSLGYLFVLGMRSLACQASLGQARAEQARAEQAVVLIACTPQTYHWP